MNMKRMRGRNNRGGGQGGGGGPPRHHSGGGGVPMNRNHVFDSSGPDLRIRGTAQQLFEKYLQLGRDASGSGDRVMAESYFQHAEHYFRILNAMAQAQQQQTQQQGGAQSTYQPQRRFSNEAGHERGENDQANDHGGDQGGDQGDQGGDQAEELQAHLNGHGEQPMPDGRDIPIASAPPDA